MSHRRAFILAGGQGRRLAPLTTVIPKPLVPIGDMSILELLLRQLASQGFSHATISLGHLGYLIEAVIGSGEGVSMGVDYTHEREPLGTAGALGVLEDLGDTEALIVINGDTLTDLDFSALVDRHIASGAAATIACRTHELRSEFGVLSTSPSGELLGYEEKPVTRHLVSMGVNVIDPALVGRLRPLRRRDMPDFLLDLKADGYIVRCDIVDCAWIDLGRLEDIRQASELYQRTPEQFLQR